MSEWQPIDTVPKDDVSVWLGHECGFMEPAYFKQAAGGFWVNLYSGLPVQWKPRFWMPLPTPPKLPGDRKHDFASDWYRPASCLSCSFKRHHPIHDMSGLKP